MRAAKSSARCLLPGAGAHPDELPGDVGQEIAIQQRMFVPEKVERIEISLRRAGDRRARHLRCAMRAAIGATLGLMIVANRALAGGDQPETPGHEPGPLQAHSLSGVALYPMQLDAEQHQKLAANLNTARDQFAREPDDVASHIWLGRRLAYLGRYREAIDVYSRALQRWPESHELYRHRGHRWVSVREFDKAIADLETATRLIEGVPDRLEPDGAPNEHNIPRSTSHSNIWYHLGLAYYLQGDFGNALRCYRACIEFCTNDDMLCATTDWLYMTLRRLGLDEEAARVLEPISADMEILENVSYHRRLLMYKGELEPDALLASDGASDLDLATQGYGVGNWYLYNGDEARAKQILARVVQGSYWPAFGFIAAEADLARLR
jgi:tetratricopeptide (TPR) repeat protein